MEPAAPDGIRALVQFWEEIPPVQRPESLTLQGVKAEVRNLATDIHRARKDLQRLRTTLLLVKDSNRRLEEKLEHVVWNQTMSLILHTFMAVFCCVVFFLHVSAGYSRGRTSIR
ncbi:uncharacterized protein LOC144406108 [Gasterosteus aculeatus]